jgi:hypothetical protein
VAPVPEKGNSCKSSPPTTGVVRFAVVADCSAACEPRARYPPPEPPDEKLPRKEKPTTGSVITVLRPVDGLITLPRPPVSMRVPK